MFKRKRDSANSIGSTNDNTTSSDMNERCSGINVLNPSSGQYISINSLWRDKPAVVVYFRRFGLVMKRSILF